MNLIAVKWLDPNSKKYIESMEQADGSLLFSVRENDSVCLNKSGQWEWEPRPSERTKAFFSRCRYSTFGEAVAALQSFIDSGVKR